MIRIRCSGGEVELAGSHEEFAALSQQVLGFAQSDETLTLTVPAETGFDPSPYEFALNSIVLIKQPSKLCATPVDHQLQLSGSAALIGLFAQNLPLDGQTACVGHHVHFDVAGWPDQIAPASAWMVFTLRAEAD